MLHRRSRRLHFDGRPDTHEGDILNFRTVLKVFRIARSQEVIVFDYFVQEFAKLNKTTYDCRL